MKIRSLVFLGVTVLAGLIALQIAKPVPPGSAVGASGESAGIQEPDAIAHIQQRSDAKGRVPIAGEQTSVDFGQGDTAKDQDGLSLFGTIRDESGGPVETVDSVTLIDDQGLEHRAEIAGGTYRSSRVQPRVYWIEAKSGIAVGELRVDLNGAVGQVEANIELVRPPHKVVLARSADGRPLTEMIPKDVINLGGSIAVVALLPDSQIVVGPPAIERYWTRDESVPLRDSDPYDEYQSIPECLAVFTLQEDQDLEFELRIGGATLEPQLVLSGQTEVVFIVDEEGMRALFSALHLRIVDADTGNSIQDCHVSVSQAAWSTMLGNEILQSEQQHLWLPGEYELLVFSGSYVSHSSTITLAPGRNDVLVELDPNEFWINGRIEFDSGAPEPSTWPPMICVTPVDGSPDSVHFDWSRVVLANRADNTFRIPVVPGTYALAVRYEGYGSAIQVVDVGGESAHAHFVLQLKAKLSLKLMSGDWRGHAYEIRDSHGFVLRDRTIDSLSRLRIGLVPGQYRLLIFDDGQVVMDERLDVADRDSTFEVWL